MSSDPLTMINTRLTVQSERADPRQVANNAGGFVFEVDEMARLRRFITLGTSGTYYASQGELTKENAGLVLDLARTRGADVVTEILAISLGGRAPKHNPTLFALAAVAGLGDGDGRKAALAALPQVARTGSMLFTFVKYVEQFRGWGRGLRNAVGGWYLDKPVDKLAYQMVKYRQRDGWTHRDLLRLASPQIPQIVNEAGDRVDVDEDAPQRRALFDFACGRDEYADSRPRLLEGFLKAQASASSSVTAGLVREYRLPWEALKPDHLNSPTVWMALLDAGMPQTALLRNLPRLTTLGLIGNGGPRVTDVAAQLATGMARAKVHPINVLIALRTYAGGQSMRGTGTWAPTPAITDALDAGFYESFGGVEPTGKRTLIALDVSGSMTTQISGLPITAREAAAAMAMVTVATEPNATVVGFTSGESRSGWGSSSYYGQSAPITPLDLSSRRRLDDVLAGIERLDFGSTDCAAPWTWAKTQGGVFDTVATFTDSETWQGPIHVHQAIRQYRDWSGLPARSIVVGMTATRWTVNDPADPLTLDIAGFDSAVPNLIADFSAGRI